MEIAIRIERTGGPDVLSAQPIRREAPGSGEVWLEQEAVGVNYLDVTQRSGAVRIPLPSGLGLEGAGRVAAVGEGVEHLETGDRVAYVLGPIGAYASGRLYPADRLIRLPAGVSSRDAAAVLFKGITAHYLLHSTFRVAPGNVLVIYGAAGALGRIMVPWAKALGAFVVGVVSSERSVTVATAGGCDRVFVWGACDLPAELRKLTAGHMADVVYDPIGRTTFEASLDCLRPRGMMVSLGASSGAPDPVSVGTLNAKGSLFLTRPGLAAHATHLAEYRERAEAVMEALQAGIVSAAVWRSFRLEEAAEAHTAMEGGGSAGAVLLEP